MSAIRNRGGRGLALAVTAATAALVAPSARADGTATLVLTTGGARTWDASGWQWTGDTGGQIFPGAGPGAGSEHAIVQAFSSPSPLNLNFASATNITIASLTLERTTGGATRHVNINGAPSGTTTTLRTNLVRYLDAAGAPSSASGFSGTNIALVFDHRIHLHADALVLDAAPDPATPPPATDPAPGLDTAKVAIRFDDSPVTFTGLTTRGTRHVEFEDDAATPSAVWNMSGPVDLEGTGALRLRYRSQGADGDPIAGTAGLTTLRANAQGGDGYARLSVQRAATTTAAVNALSFSATTLDSHLAVTADNARVNLGHLHVNGHRTLWSPATGTTGTAAAAAVLITSITGDAASELTIAGGATWSFDTPLPDMRGAVAVADAHAHLNAAGAMGATAVAKPYGEIDLNFTPAPTDRFDIRAGGILRGNLTQLNALTVGGNLALEPGAVIVPDPFPPNPQPPIIQNLGASANYFLGLGADLGASTPENVSVGPGTPWAGLSADRAARRWNQGVITATGDIALRSGRHALAGTPLTLGNGTAAGAVSIVTPQAGPARVNVTLDGRIDLDDDASDFTAAHFVAAPGAELRLLQANALGGATASIETGATLLVTGPGSATAINGDLHLQAGATFHINAQTADAAPAGLAGSGTITRAPNITVHAANPQALNGPQFTPAHLQAGDLLRLDASDIRKIDQVPGGVAFQLTNADRSQAPGVHLDGGAILTDGASRAWLAAGGTATNTITVGPLGATFAASSPTILTPPYPLATPTTVVPTVNTLTVNVPVSSSAAANIDVGSPTPIHGLNRLGHVTFNGPFSAGGNVHKLTPGDLVFDHPATTIAGDLVISGGTGPAGTSRVKLGNDNVNLSPRIVDGTLARRIVLGDGTSLHLNLDTTGFDGAVGQSTGRLHVPLEIVVNGAPGGDETRLRVDRRRAASLVGLVSLDNVVLNEGAVLTVQNFSTETRTNLTLAGNAATVQTSNSSTPQFDLVDVASSVPGSPRTLTIGSRSGGFRSAHNVYGIVTSDVTLDIGMGRLYFQDGAVLNGTASTANRVKEAWIQVRAGHNGTSGFLTGTGQIDVGAGEDLYGYIDSGTVSKPLVNTIPLQVNILPSGGIIAAEYTNGVGSFGTVRFTNVHLQPGSVLTLRSDAGTSANLHVGGVLEGDAEIHQIAPTSTRLTHLTGPHTLRVTSLTSGTNVRTLTINAALDIARLVVGSTGVTRGRVSLITGAALPAVELTPTGELTVAPGNTVTVASIKSANPAANAISIGGARLVIRPAPDAAASTTSVISSLNLGNALTGMGTLDIGAYNRLAYDYTGPSPLASIRESITQRRGIVTSSATSNASLALGYAEASDLLGPAGGAFGTETVDGDTILIRATLLGDANLDGAVDFADLVRLAQNYDNLDGARNWSDGDFTYNGSTDFADLVLLAQHYNTTIPTAPVPGAPADFQTDLARAFATVPEPAALPTLCLAASALTPRRRRRRARRTC